MCREEPRDVAPLRARRTREQIEVARLRRLQAQSDVQIGASGRARPATLRDQTWYYCPARGDGAGTASQALSIRAARYASSIDDTGLYLNEASSSNACRREPGAHGRHAVGYWGGACTIGAAAARIFSRVPIRGG
jgi:hypothetical protein